jgi:AraC-like DNA-binding protein
MYREIAPSPQWSDTIECFWTISQPHGEHRVTPDGCADIILSANELMVVGAMTGYRDFPPAAGPLFGVRFRPARWALQFGIPADRLTDELIPLETLWGARAGSLCDRLNDAKSAEARAILIEKILAPGDHPTPVQRAIRWMEHRQGRVSIDALARQCSLSARQFRRLCIEESGLGPKFLARVLRFRHALTHSGSSAADIALECGYYDQAHFINEFRFFSGRTPTGRESMSVFSNLNDALSDTIGA